MHKSGRIKGVLIAVLLAVSVACALTFTACGKKTLDRIEILTPPLKVEYVEGEKFNPVGMIVAAYYSDKSVSAVTDYTMRPDADTELDTSYTKVTVFYTEGEITKSADVAITVTEKQSDAPVKEIFTALPSKIPDKYQYKEGETFSVDGMEWTVVYTDGTSGTVKFTDETKGVTLNPSGALTFGTAQVEVTYGGFTVPIVVIVTKANPDILLATVKKQPKTQYEEGETFSVDGMEWTVTYTDGTSGTVKFTDETEGVSFTPSGALAPSDTSVSVTYKGYTLSKPIAITVKEKIHEIPPSPTAIIVDHEVIKNGKTEYFDGEMFNITGLEINFFYDDGGNKVVKFTKSMAGLSYTAPTLRCDNGKTESEETLPITYTGYRFYVTVTVRRPDIEEVTLVASPDKTTYIAGETFNPAGMTVRVKWEDGYIASNINITAANSEYSKKPLTIDTNSINVCYTDGYYYGYVEVPIRVIDIKKITITTPPTKTEYVAGQSFDPAGMEIQVTYVDNVIENVWFDRSTEGLTLPEDALTASDTSVTLYYYNYPITVDIEMQRGVYIEAEDAHVNSSNGYTVKDDAVDQDGKPNASGGRYLSEIDAGDSINFIFYSDKTGKGELAFILASQYLKRDNQWTPIEMGDCQFNKICKFSVNGEQYEIPNSVILPGGTKNVLDNPLWLWFNWKEVVFEDVDFVQGRNDVVLEFIPHNYKDCSQSSFNGVFGANVDSLKVTSEECEVTAYSYNYEVTEANLTDGGNNVLLAVSGNISYVNYTEEELAEVLKNTVKTGLKLRSLEAVRELTNYSATVEGEAFTVYVSLSDIKFAGEYYIIVNGEELKIPDTNDYVNVNHYRYSLFNYNEYALINIYQEDEFEIVQITDAKIEEGADGEVLYCLTGIYSASDYYTEDEIKAELAHEYFDLQENQYAYSYNWNGRWENIRFEAVEVILNTHNGTFTIKYDITELEDFCYTMHFRMGYNWDNDANDLIWKPSDVKPDFSLNRSVTINGRRYTLICVPDSGDGAQYWGCIGLKIVTL